MVETSKISSLLYNYYLLVPTDTQVVSNSLNYNLWKDFKEIKNNKIFRKLVENVTRRILLVSNNNNQKN